MKIFKAIAVVAVLALSILGYNYYQDTYAGKEYFVKITKTVPRTDILDNDGKKMDEGYSYKVTAYSKNGDDRKLEFDWRADNALPKGTWLKITASNQRVISEEVIKESEVPEKVQNKF